MQTMVRPAPPARAATIAEQNPMEVKFQQQARLLKALADPTRLRILSILLGKEGLVCVKELVDQFTLEQPTISHHLRILRDAGLITLRKQGLFAYYYLCRDRLQQAEEILASLV